MSTIWTPSGERPIGRQPEPEPQPAARPSAAAPGTGEPSEEELRAHFAEVQRQLLETPAAVVVANHCIGLFQLAVLHLEQSPARLPDAKLAIDAFAAIVETLGSRLADEEEPLRQGLAQLRLAYVERQRTPNAPPAS